MDSYLNFDSVLKGVGPLDDDLAAGLRRNYLVRLIGAKDTREASERLVDLFGKFRWPLDWHSIKNKGRIVGSLVRLYVVNLSTPDDVNTAVRRLASPFLQDDPLGTYDYRLEMAPGVLLGLLESNAELVRDKGCEVIVGFLPQVLTPILKSQIYNQRNEVSDTARQLYQSCYQSPALLSLFYTAAREFALMGGDNRKLELVSMRRELADHFHKIDSRIRAVVLPSCYRTPEWSSVAREIIKAMRHVEIGRLRPEELLELGLPVDSADIQ